MIIFGKVFFIMSFKSKFFRVSNTITKPFSFGKFSGKLPFQNLIVVYHLVSDQDVKHARHLFPYRSVAQFEKDLDFLQQHFEMVDWETFLKLKTEKIKTKKPTILLTFDDGYSEFYNIIAPILQKKGIYAMNFINPKFIDNKELMWRNKASLIVSEILEKKALQTKISDFPDFNKDLNKSIKSILNITFEHKNMLDDISSHLKIDFTNYLKKHPVYLTTEQLQKLKNDGFGISSHGWDHPLYNQLLLNEQLENTQKSLDFMAENHFLSDTFAFPFTDHLVNHNFFDSVFNQNPDLKFTFGAAGLKLDSYPKNLQRIPIENADYSAEEILKNEILYYRFLKKLNKNQIIRS